MIRFIVKRGFEFTVSALGPQFDAPAPSCGALAYEDLFAAGEIAPGAYVFSDIERLSDIELHAAAFLYDLMSRLPGVRCFNNPARVKTRYALLRALREAGMQRF